MNNTDTPASRDTSTPQDEMPAPAPAAATDEISEQQLEKISGGMKIDRYL